MSPTEEQFDSARPLALEQWSIAQIHTVDGEQIERDERRLVQVVCHPTNVKRGGDSRYFLVMASHN
jgi:hypothetical protein